jgi:hypothetical protein
MHAARRRQCWDWWNDDWRDRILAFLASLAGEGESLLLPAGGESLQLSLSPLLFTSPRAYEITGKSAVAPSSEEPETKSEEVDAEELEEEMEDDDDVF